MPSTDLRERQASVVRDAILDALAELLETVDPEDIALPEVAHAAGVSIRTLYRYFATREDLFEAAGDRIVARLGLPRDIPTADDITPVFLKSAELGARNLRLARSLLSTPLGRRARSPHRRRRVESITAALAEVTAHLPAAEARRRAGAITHLASMAAWVTVSEESGLSAEDARLGIAWALDVLIGHLREETRNEAVSRSRRRR